MSIEQEKKYNENIGYLKYRLTVVENIILSCESGKEGDTSVLEKALIEKKLLQSKIKREHEKINNEEQNLSLAEEDLLRQNRIR